MKKTIILFSLIGGLALVSFGHSSDINFRKKHKKCKGECAASANEAGEKKACCASKKGRKHCSMGDEASKESTNKAASETAK